MQGILKYKGYTGSIEVDTEDRIFHGRVLDIKDVVTYCGSNYEELEQDFQESIEDYLEYCQELGEEPDKPFSGKLPLRTTPENHRKIFLAAQKSGQSINAWMEAVLQQATDQIV